MSHQEEMPLSFSLHAPLVNVRLSVGTDTACRSAACTAGGGASAGFFIVEGLPLIYTIQYQYVSPWVLWAVPRGADAHEARRP